MFDFVHAVDDILHQLSIINPELLYVFFTCKVFPIQLVLLFLKLYDLTYLRQWLFEDGLSLSLAVDEFQVFDQRVLVLEDVNAFQELPLFVIQLILLMDASHSSFHQPILILVDGLIDAGYHAVQSYFPLLGLFDVIFPFKLLTLNFLSLLRFLFINGINIGLYLG